MDVDLVQCMQVVHIMVEINASKDCSAGQKILLLSSSALLTIFPFFPQLTHFHGFLRHSSIHGHEYSLSLPANFIKFHLITAIIVFMLF